MKKIAYFITGFGRAGAERLLCDVSNFLQADYEIEITHFKGTDESKSRLNTGIPVRKIPLGFGAIRSVRRYLKQFRPDIIHTHFGQGDFISLPAALGLGIPTFCTLHNVYIKNNWLDIPLFWAYRFLLNVLSPKTRVFCISKSVERHALHVLKIQPKRVFLLYNAISGEEKLVTPAENQPHMKRKGFTLLYAGRLTPVKNPLLLLDSVSELQRAIPDLQIIMLGKGPLLEAARNHPAVLENPNTIHVVGEVPQIDPYLDISDVFVSTSLREGFGMVILEAMKARVPVVAPAVEGPEELIENGVNGILYQAGNKVDFMEQVIRIYDDHALRQKIKENGFHTFSEKFTLRAHASKLVATYRLSD